MLESLIGPDMMKKIISKLAALIAVILAWIGLMMIMMTVFIPIDVFNAADVKTGSKLLVFHAHFWPMLLAFCCAAAGLVISKRGVKMILYYVVIIASLWVMLNVIMGWVQPPSGTGMGDMVGPLMKPLQVVGAFMGTLGGLVGFLGTVRK